MIFEETRISGVWRVSLERHEDARGYFARTFCADEFANHGLAANFEQHSVASNVKRGTLRGMHFQFPPNAEIKFVRCVRGAIYDVAIDLRPDSPTYRQWVSEILSADNGVGLYVAEGIAHGYQTLTDDADVLYQITPKFRPGFGQGVRWNDPVFGVAWPISDPILSERDAQYPDYKL